MGDVRQDGLSEQARQALAARLTRELGGEQALTGTPCAAYAIQGRTPAVVARPATLDALAAALTLAAEAGASVA
ncbi:MAG TPA: hypothetical protein VIC27_00875, partial [Ktedonobacterales bacterium]